MTKQLFGAVMLDVAGLELTQTEREIINHPNTGAVILFARNYQDPEQVSALINAIRAARKGDILVAVDQEGGRVQRFRNGFTRLPPAAFYQQQPELAEASGWLMAAEVLAVGADFSFAPVLDVDCGISEIIGDRSFATNAEKATELARAFCKGMKQAGMAATGKHFPGHGAVALDSHLTLPVDERGLDEIRARDLVPFKALIAEGLAAIMPAHVLYPKVDAQPAGFSKFWLQEILRAELRFNGTIFSDDLSMAGAAIGGDFVTRATLAQDAGCDMILVCNHPEAAETVIEQLPITQDSLREQRLQAMRGKAMFNRVQLRQQARWQETVAALESALV